MAATAAAAIGTSFAPSIHSLKCITTHSKNYPSDSFYKISTPSSSKTVLASLFCLFPVECPLPMVALSSLRTPRVVSAAVAQEEAAATASVEVQKGGEEVTEAEVSVNTKLYFGNLPYNVDSAQLAGIIQDYVSPELIEVLYNRETGKSRGFAFVTMSTIEDCNAVIENLDGSQYMGRTLRVNFADKPKPKEPLYPETEFKLFVGNLSWSVTSESLTEAFEKYGNVVGARVLYDGETGRSRGYGFVCYSTSSEMENALEYLNGVELEGRAMRVSLAQGRKS